MPKLLLTGCVSTLEQWNDIVLQRVNKLNASAHGPFDLCIVPLGDDEGENVLDSIQDKQFPFADKITECIFHNYSSSDSSSTKHVQGLDLAFDNNKNFNADASISIDILFSRDFPKGFDNGLVTPPPAPSTLSSSMLVQSLKPRYHIITSSNVFYERPPYKNNDNNSITRLIALAPPSNTKLKSKKFIHALKLEKNQNFLNVQNATENPYTRNIATESSQRSFSRYGPALVGGHAKRRRKNKNAPLDPGACWFCLANPEIEKHLIASIANDAYVALPKGGLSADHVLVIPVEHTATFHKTSPDVASYVLALAKYFKAQDKSMFVFERNVRFDNDVMQHGHLQVVGIPNAAVKDAEKVLLREGEVYNMEFNALKNGVEEFHEEEDNHQYLRAQVFDNTISNKEEGVKTYLHLVHDVRKHFLQFGRHVAAILLNVSPERVDWKCCKLPQADEVSLTSAFKQAFKPFDIA